MGFKFHSYFSQLPYPSPLGHGVQDSYLLPPSFPKLVVRFTLVLPIPHSSLLNLFNTLTLLNIFYYFIIPLTGLASITHNHHIHKSLYTYALACSRSISYKNIIGHINLLTFGLIITVININKGSLGHNPYKGT